MRRVRHLLALPFVMVALVACDSPTDLDEVGMVGRWDATGDFRVNTAPELRLNITADAAGAFTGTWSQQGVTGARPLGGQRTGSSVQITLEAYPLPGGGFGSRTFVGEIDGLWVMKGTLNLGDGASASFRRTSFSP